MGRFKNRWVYALTAFMCSAIVPAVLLIALAINGGQKGGYLDIFKDESIFLFSLIVGISAAVAAVICWPTFTKRTAARMTIAGLFTVMLAFILMPLFLILRKEIPSGFDSSQTNIFDIANALFGWLILGSIFTFGIPYIIGILASSAFVEHPLDVNAKKVSKRNLFKRFAVEETTR